jgi:hypothetical protein
VVVVQECPPGLDETRIRIERKGDLLVAESTVQRVSFGRSKFDFGGHSATPPTPDSANAISRLMVAVRLVALRLKFGATAVVAILPPVVPVLATVTREMARVLATPNAGRLRDARYQPRSRR